MKSNTRGHSTFCEGRVSSKYIIHILVPLGSLEGYLFPGINVLGNNLCGGRTFWYLRLTTLIWDPIIRYLHSGYHYFKKIIKRSKMLVPEKLNEMDRRSALASIIGHVILFFAYTECLLLFHFSHVNTFFF